MVNYDLGFIHWRHRNATRHNWRFLLLCRIFCVNHESFTALHMYVKRNNISRTQLCRPHMNKKQLHEIENVSHESEMVASTKSILTQRRVACW